MNTRCRVVGTCFEQEETAPKKENGDVRFDATRSRLTFFFVQYVYDSDLGGRTMQKLDSGDKYAM